MAEPFHKRFDIEINTKESQQRFLERLRNSTIVAMSEINVYSEALNKALHIACFKLGKRPNHVRHVLGNAGFMARWDEIVGNDFTECLRMTEAVHEALRDININLTDKRFSGAITKALAINETDLEIVWDGNIFTRKGAQYLDDHLVNDPLHWLREAKQDNVLKPFEKGMGHWMEVHKNPERCGDVVTDMYESLEALAKIETKPIGSLQEIERSLLRKSDCQKSTVIC